MQLFSMPASCPGRCRCALPQLQATEQGRDVLKAQHNAFQAVELHRLIEVWLHCWRCRRPRWMRRC